ncbi:MAG: flagellar motor switch protein FliM [Armatimonadetes bacterium]|nr:flagellar motor switch protein FliM [Armatimonadota bacterium]
MSEILSQADIEALLAQLSTSESSDSDEASDDPLAQLRKRTSYEPYDFRRPDKFSREHLRTLQMVHETFARLAGTNLSAYLRSPIQLEVVELMQTPFEEYLRSLNQSAFVTFTMPPLAGQCVFEMEFSLLFTLVDRLLGGPGKAMHRTTLTDVERPLVIGLAERILIALRGAWEGIMTLEPMAEGLETSPQFVQIAPPGDVVLTILMEARVGEQCGACSVCIPHMVIKPVTAKLSSQKWNATSGRRSSAQTRAALTAQLNEVKTRCSVTLGQCKLKVSEVLNLSPGDVLALQTPVNGLADMYVAGRLKFRGRPATRNKKLAISLIEAIDEE